MATPTEERAYDADSNVENQEENLNDAREAAANAHKDAADEQRDAETDTSAMSLRELIWQNMLSPNNGDDGFVFNR